MTLKALWGLLKDTARDWKEDKADRLAAALAFYTVLSLAPLVVIAVSVAGLVVGEEAARGQLSGQIATLVGPQAGAAIEGILANAHKPSAGVVGTIVGAAALLLGASGVFGELQDSLNTIWEVTPKPGRGLWGVLRDRFFSFTMVLGVGFMLLVSLVVSTALAAAGKVLSGALPGGETLWGAVNFVVSFGIITTLFALIYKAVPDVKVHWGDVWVGALVTALLFTLGKIGIGLYLGKSTVASAYGAAASVVVITVWVYYSAQILFLGAEFTQVYARTFGSRIEPSKNAIPVTPEARAQQGLVPVDVKEKLTREQGRTSRPGGRPSRPAAV
ncbi:MAG TPA: YihY/virulence factor BrkB family protein [Polyangiaceae bacterium]|nr:YihY/virulence factor BrkB family protein [Polyangiaceae bacterium]